MYKPGDIYQGDNDNNPIVTQSAKGATMQQKVVLISIVLVFFFTFTFWLYRFSVGLKQPFAYNGADDANSIVESEADIEARNIEKLMTLDTDKDGLSDYDELYVYKTSPYLEDTDSDGFLDGKEVETENDPNCMKGWDCGKTSGLVNAEASLDEAVVSSATSSFKNIATVSGSASQAYAGSAISTSSIVSGGEKGDMLSALLGGGVSTSSLREILLSSGMKKEQLDAISDEQLMQSYRGVLSGQEQ